MFSWYPVMDLARAPRRAARKKGSGYENAEDHAVLTFVTYRECERTWESSRCSIFNMDDFLLIERAQLIWKYCFTTGASKGSTGVNAPVVIQLKNALYCIVVNYLVFIQYYNCEFHKTFALNYFTLTSLHCWNYISWQLKKIYKFEIDCFTSSIWNE
jgi:hypothetical protein